MFEEEIVNEIARKTQIPLAPSTGLIVGCVFVMFALVEAEWIMDLMILYAHHAPWDSLLQAWAYQLIVCVSLLGYVRAWYKRGIVRVGGQLKDFSIMYFSMATFFLLLSLMLHHLLVADVVKVKYSIGL